MIINIIIPHMSLAIIINILNRVVIDNDDDNGDRDDDDILIYNLL